MYSSRISMLSQQKGLNFLGEGVGFFVRPKCMMLNWNFQRGGVKKSVQTTEYKVIFNHAPNEPARLVHLLLCYPLLS